MINFSLDHNCIQKLASVFRELSRSTRLLEDLQVAEVQVSNKTTWTARDFGFVMSIVVPCANEGGEGSIMLDIAKLASVLPLCSDQAVFTEIEQGILVKANGAEWRLSRRTNISPINKAELFDEAPASVEIVPVSLLASGLGHALKAMPSAADRLADERYRSCLIEKNRLVASNGVKAVIRSLPVGGKFALQRRVAEMLVRLADIEPDGNLAIWPISQGYMLVLSGGLQFRIMTALPQVPPGFINVDNLVAVPSCASFTIDREAMIRLLRCTYPTNSEATRSVELKVEPGSLRLRTQDIGGESLASAVISLEGEPFLINFNADFMNQCLGTLDAGSIGVHVIKKGFVRMSDAAGNIAILALMRTE